MITIALIDDHQLFRKSLVLLLNTFESIAVEFESDDGHLLLEFLKEHRVDIVLLDLQMPKIDGFGLCEQLKNNFPDVKVLIVSQLTTKESIHRVMELGANGFFSKNSPPEQLELAIQSVIDKDIYFDLELSCVIREAILWEKSKQNQLETGLKPNFSPREIDVLKLSCKEFSSKEIGVKLFISTRTVEKHRNRIMERSNSKNLIGSIIYALKHNYLSLEDI